MILERTGVLGCTTCRRESAEFAARYGSLPYVYGFSKTAWRRGSIHPAVPLFPPNFTAYSEIWSLFGIESRSRGTDDASSVPVSRFPDDFFVFLPPPGLRIRELVGADKSVWPAAISSIPFLIVLGEIRNALLTIVIPPRPNFNASAPAQWRR